MNRPSRKVKLVALLVFLVFFIDFASFFIASLYYLGKFGREGRFALPEVLKNPFKIDDSSKTEKEKDSVDISRFHSDTVHATGGGDLISLVEKVSPAVVTVENNVGMDDGLLFMDLRGARRSGTGFFISDDGLLVTNEHVVCGLTSMDVNVVTSDGRSFAVTSISVDSAQDVAILKVDTRGEKVPYLKFANPSAELKVGQEVIAIGNPFGNNPGSVTKGIISGLNRNIVATGSCGPDLESKSYEGMIQTDAAINSGNSGGPLLNIHGEVIGINSATVQGANNVSYTVPHRIVLKVIQRYIKNNGKIVAPFIGVRQVFVNPRNDLNLPGGAYVVGVQPNSPADVAGIKPGDILVRIGEYDIDFSLVTKLNQNFEPNDETMVKVFRYDRKRRSGDYLDLKIKIGERVYENR